MEKQLELFPGAPTKKDWRGTPGSIFKNIGASNHTEKERQGQDFYATDPLAGKLLLQRVQFAPKVWECACGQDHLANVFREAGYEVRSSDIVDRCGNEVYDFLDMGNTHWDGDIVTNPPYRYATEFVRKALAIIPEGNKVAMFLKVQFLEGKERRELYDSTPPIGYMFSPSVLIAL